MNNYVVIDLEMCNVPKGRRSKFRAANEIIEIGAVLLDERLQITDQFKTFVRPQFGWIDQHIENLTRIKPKQVSSAPTFSEALEMFFQWLPEDVTMVAWSDNDARQLRKESKLKSIESERLDNLLENSMDCQRMFGEKIDSPKTYALSEALIIADVEYDEGAHDGLIDAHNTALLFAKVVSEEEITLNAYYQNLIHPVKYCPFADLLKNYSVAG